MLVQFHVSGECPHTSEGYLLITWAPKERAVQESPSLGQSIVWLDVNGIERV